MPIYEYSCPKCHKVFEEWVKSHDTSAQNCPYCGALAEHIVSNTSFVLKGGGWYVTEYGNRKNSEAKENTASPDKPKSSEKASENTSGNAEGTESSANGKAAPTEKGSKSKETKSTEINTAASATATSPAA